MATSRGLNVFVNIGATVGSSVNASASKVEQRISAMGRKVRIAGAELGVAFSRFQQASHGIAGLVAAGGIGLTFKSILGESNEYEHQLQMLRNAGRTTTEVAQAIAAAHKTMVEVPTSTLTDSLKLISETTLAYGGLGHAIENLSFNQRMGAMLKNVMGDHAASEGEMFNQLVRALELRGGKMSTTDYQRQAAKLFQAFEVSGGTVNPENFLGFAQQAAIPLRGYSEDYLTRVVPSLIQEFGGERAGTVSTSFYNQLMGRVGLGGKAVTDEWVRLGLVSKAGIGSNHSKTGWKPEALKGYQLGREDPLAWVETVLFPALQAHGINTDDKNAMLLQAQKMFGRETGKRLASTLFDKDQRARIHADQKLYEQALGPDAAYTQALAKDPKLAVAAAGASLKNLEVTIGRIFTPTVIKAANTFAGAVNWLSATFERHPGFAKALGVVGAALAGLGTVSVVGHAVRFVGSGLELLGTAARVAGGFLMPLVERLMPLRFAMVLARYGVGGLLLTLGELAIAFWPVTLAIAAIGVAIAVVVAKWNGIKAFFAGMAAGFSKALSPEARAAMANLGSALSGLFGAIGKALSPLVDMFKAVFGWIGKLFAPANATAWGKAGENFGGILGRMVSGLAGFINKVAEAVRWIQHLFETAAGGGAVRGFVVGGVPGALAGAALGAVSPSQPAAPSPAPARPGAAPVAPQAPATRPQQGVPSTPAPPHRAAGGPVDAGRVYEVNEQGRELFMPGSSGTIIPARATAAILAAMSGGAPAPAQPVVMRGATVVIQDARDPKATAREVRAELQRMAYEASGYLSD